MKTLLPFFAILFLTLVGCQQPVTSAPGGATPLGAPTHVSASGLKAVYLAGSTTSANSVTGRAVVSSAGATLGGILPTGVPTKLDFLDADGVATTATVTQAMQLTDTYVLVQYTVGDASTLAALNVVTGRLASIDKAPDVWGAVYPFGSAAYYEAGGSIVKADLEAGTTEVLSTGQKVYQASGSNTPSTPTGSVGAWDSSAFVYVDNVGTAYAIDLTTSGNIRGTAVTVSGVETDIGASLGVYAIGNVACGNAGNPSPFVVDPATNSAYWVQFPAENGWDSVHGWSYQTGWSVSILSVIFSTNGVDFSTSNAPLATYHLATLAELPDQTYMGRLGYGLKSSSAIWVDGAKATTLSFAGSTPTAEVFDTSSVPQLQKIINGQRYPGVPNFRYVGGHLYYGPSSTQTIGTVALGNPSTVHQLVAGTGTISAWTVVGGVLFWTDSAGSWQATVDTQAGTLGTVTPYTGGQVVGVTG